MTRKPPPVALTPTDILVPVLAGIAGIGFATCIWLIFTWAPNDQILFFNQRIFYFHVGHAFMLLIGVGISGIASIGFLITRKPRWDDVALAAAEVSVAFGIGLLASGMIWAKAAWDHWWVWENRLVMSALLWLVLVAYVIVRRYAGAGADRISAGLAVFGMVTVPFIYTMVNQGDQHPQAGANGNVATLHGDMLIMFWMSIATFAFWFVALILSRVSSARAERELRELREKAFDTGILT